VDHDGRVELPARGVTVDAGTVKAVAIAGAVGMVAFVAWRAAGAAGRGLSAAGQAVADTARAAGQVADTAVSAPVFAVGDAFGIPRTNMTECERHKAAGDAWEASFACPAGDFLTWLASPDSAPKEAPRASSQPAQQIDRRRPDGDTFEGGSGAGYDWIGAGWSYGMP
jgi:hypothetical protein